MNTTTYATLLHHLADILDAHPDLPLPTLAPGSGVFFLCTDPEQMAWVVDAFKVPMTVQMPDGSDYYDNYLVVSGAWHGAPLRIVGERRIMCVSVPATRWELAPVLARLL